MSKFRILGDLDETCRPTFYPHSIYGIVAVEGQIVYASSDNLADPAVGDFLVVYCKLNRNRWAADFRGRLVEVEWLDQPMGFKGYSFLDVGYVYAPYVPKVLIDPI